MHACSTSHARAVGTCARDGGANIYGSRGKNFFGTAIPIFQYENPLALPFPPAAKFTERYSCPKGVCQQEQFEQKSILTMRLRDVDGPIITSRM